MAKRANGEGSIRFHKPSGKWITAMPTGLHLPSGKREYIYRYSDSQSKAKDILHQLQAERNLGMSQAAGTTPTGIWIERWINMDREKPLAPSTLTSYRTNFRLHINPAIGKIPLNKLTTDEIQRALKKAGGSKSKFIKIRNIIHASLQLAVDRRILQYNPCKGVVAPYEKEKKARALSKDEQAALIKALEDEYYKPMIEMYLGTGLRMGEGIPLLWSDIKLDASQRYIDVNKKPSSFTIMPLTAPQRRYRTFVRRIPVFARWSSQMDWLKY